MQLKGILTGVLISAIFALGLMVGIGWVQRDKAEIAEATFESKDANEPNNEADAYWDAEKAVINLFENAAPSVVYITTSTRQEDWWSRSTYEVPSGSGSGFIWDKQGHIVTNYHVIKDASKVQVVLEDQTSLEATFVGADPTKDIAVLKIQSNKHSLDPLPVGSSKHLKVGQSVFAIGNPFGLDQTLTTGVVSALGREITSVANTQITDVIQTDAAINPGNSGGPLLNSKGELIGINTAIYSPSGASAGIGFSVPVSAVSFVVPEIVKYGKVRRPHLGIEFFEESKLYRLRRRGIKGLLVKSVKEGTAADKAGIQETRQDEYGNLVLGDLIVSIDGKDLESFFDLMVALENYKIGDTIELDIVRDGKLKTVEVLLEKIG